MKNIKKMVITHFELMDRLPWYVGLLLFIGGALAVAVMSWVVCDWFGRVFGTMSRTSGK